MAVVSLDLRIMPTAFAAALACACGEPEELAQPVDRDDSEDAVEKKSNVDPGSDTTQRKASAPKKDESDGSAGTEVPPPAALPAFAEPADKKPSRTVPRAVFRWSEHGDGEQNEAEDAFHESVREEVEALVAEAAAGNPRLITLRVGNTLGWGCGCPQFVIPYEVGGALYDDEFVIHLLADGVPEIESTVFGIFRLIGHYTGRRLDTGPDNDKIGTRAYPEFHVHGWCYIPPAAPREQEYEAPQMRKMRDSGAPLCKAKHWPKWIEQSPVVDASPESGP